MKCLILIDKKFPYDSGEPFLENEINTYTEIIDKIYIFPIDIGSDSIKTRKVPHNVKIITTNTCTRKKLHHNIVLKSVTHFLKKDVRDTINNNHFSPNIKNCLFCAYLLNICQIQCQSIINHLKNLEFDRQDQIVIYSYWFYTTAYIATHIKKYFKDIGIDSKVVTRAHRFDIYDKEQPFKIETLKGVDSVYPCSDNGTKYLKNYFTDFQNKFKTAYLGTMDCGLPEASMQNNKFTIVSCSRITAIKRVERIAYALKILDSKIHSVQIRWIHIGNGKGIEKLQKYCNSELKSIEVELKGYMQNQEIYNFYKHNYVNLFINVSASEGLPVSIMEAISFGIPVVATKVGGTDEIVIDKKNGRILEADFKTSYLAEMIEYYISMPKEKYHSYRKYSRIYWEKKYNAALNYERFIAELFDE